MLNLLIHLFVSLHIYADLELPKVAAHYYGKDISRSKSGDFKEELHRILNLSHIVNPDDFDEIVETCQGLSTEKCYGHLRHSYKTARQYMFGLLYLKQLGNDQYSLQSVYCETSYSNKNLPLGPMTIPPANTLNAEHSWPQSLFSSQFSKSFQKSDLHALYPVRMTVNSTRGNHPFGEVVEVKSLPCEESALGYNDKHHLVFEPAESIKGNVARSLFYFSVRYKMSIDSEQEQVLRRWHDLDPVDAEEIDRHDEVFKIQQVRNPFVDRPEWVSEIPNF